MMTDNSIYGFSFVFAHNNNNRDDFAHHLFFLRALFDTINLPRNNNAFMTV